MRSFREEQIQRKEMDKLQELPSTSHKSLTIEMDSIHSSNSSESGYGSVQTDIIKEGVHQGHHRYKTQEVGLAFKIRLLHLYIHFFLGTGFSI